MKKLIFPFVFVILLSLLFASCTADELPETPPTDISQDDNVPPIVIKPNPGP